MVKTQTPKGRALGSALRQVREERGVKLRDLAAQLERDPGVVSRWETGQRTPRPEQVAQILTELGVNGEQFERIVSLAYDTDQPRWLAASLPERQQQLSALVDCEQDASRITSVSPLLVPGLLQVSSYVRAMMLDGGVPSTEIGTRVAVRIGRRDVLTRADPVQYVGLMGEAALQQLIGDAAVMAEQLRFLLDVSLQSNISLHVIPQDKGWNPAVEGAFTVIESTETPPVVHVENRRSGLFFHEEGDVSAYEDAMRFLGEFALTTGQSRKLITEYLARWESLK